MRKYIEIDGVSYPVHLIEVKRKADTLDLQSYRSEDGVLHRKVIGTYMNYSVTIGVEENLDLYDRLFDVLSAPVEYHMVKFPNESVALKRYISSVQDDILRVTDEGTLYKGLSFNAICTEPTKRA
jgi:hypothetical protein